MSENVTNTETSDNEWKSLYTVGGVAALVAGVIFRRNISAEISLFSPLAPPDTVNGWFALLHEHRLLGLAYLNIFDLVDYALTGLMLLALYIALRRTNKSAMTIALTLGFMGMALYFSTNTAFSLLSLSNQYAAAATDAQRAMLLAAGQAMLALNEFSSGGNFMSLFLIALAGMITSLVMLRSNIFNRATAYTGIFASSLDLVYCIVIIFVPMANSELVTLSTIPAAGLLLMIWHILVGLQLIRLGRKIKKAHI